MQGRTPQQLARGSRVHATGLVVNTGLAVMKLVGGWIAGSPALLADGVHSLSDTATSLVGWFTFRWAGKPADDDHHYGHGKAEALAASVVGLVLVGAGALMVVEAVIGEGPSYERGMGLLALSLAAVSMAVNEWLHRLAASAGRDLKSPSLLALAQDCRSDALASLLVVLGVGCAMAGLPQAEILAAGLIGGLILVMGLKTVRGAVDILMDRVPDPHMRGTITELVTRVQGVRRVERVGIHPLGHQLRVDMEIGVDADLSVRKGHAIAHLVEEAVISAESRVVEVAVHVNPVDSPT